MQFKLHNFEAKVQFKLHNFEGKVKFWTENVWLGKNINKIQFPKR